MVVMPDIPDIEAGWRFEDNLGSSVSFRLKIKTKGQELVYWWNTCLAEGPEGGENQNPKPTVQVVEQRSYFT